MIIIGLLIFAILFAGCSQQAQDVKKTEPEKNATTQTPKPKIEAPPVSAAEEKPQPEKPETMKNNSNTSIAPPSKDPLSPNFNPIAFGNPHPKLKQGNYGECCNHPYWHKVYRAFSDNGISWQKENKLIKKE